LDLLGACWAELSQPAVDSRKRPESRSSSLHRLLQALAVLVCMDVHRLELACIMPGCRRWVRSSPWTCTTATLWSHSSAAKSAIPLSLAGRCSCAMSTMLKQSRCLCSRSMQGACKQHAALAQTQQEMLMPGSQKRQE